MAPPALEPWALEAVCGAAASGLDECLAGGMLVDDGRPIALPARARPDGDRGGARRRPPARLHRALLSRARRARPRGIDPGPAGPPRRGGGRRRGRAAATRRSPRAAPRRSARTARRRRSTRARCGSPRRARRRAGRARARLADALYATDDQVESIAACERAIELLRAAGDAPARGRPCAARRRRSSCRGMMAGRRAAAERAIALLEPLPARRRRWRAAYASLALLALYRDDFDAAVEWGERAVESPSRRRRDAGRRAHLDRARASCCATARRGRELERGLEVAREHGLEQRSRAHSTTWRPAAVAAPRARAGRAHIEAGLAHCAEHDLDLWTLSTLGLRPALGARTRVARRGVGDRDQARRATRATRRRRGSRACSCWPLVRARRGDPASGRRSSRRRDRAPRTSSTGSGRWRRSRPRRPGWPATSERHRRADAGAFALARDAHVPWMLGELACWRRRAGIDEPIANPVAEPWALELEGRHGRPQPPGTGWAARTRRPSRWRWAATGWRRRTGGCRSWAPAALRPSARGGCAERGVRGSPAARARDAREPGEPHRRASWRCSRWSPTGSATPRSPRAFTSRPRTVDHHVSTILRKLEVPSRARASSRRRGSASCPWRPEPASVVGPANMGRTTDAHPRRPLLPSIALVRTGRSIDGHLRDSAPRRMAHRGRSRGRSARSTAEGERMPDDIRWIRSYVLAEPDGRLGTVCIYQAAARRRSAATRRPPTCRSTRSSRWPTPCSCGPTRCRPAPEP